MATIRQDLGFAVRSLKKSPAFAVTAFLTIALGIGATTAIFSVVNTVLLRPLPYPDASRLVFVQSDMTARNVKDFPLPPGDYADFRERATLFEQVGAVFTARQPLLANDGTAPERIPVAGMTPSVMSIFGMRTMLGRVFVDADGTPPPAPAAGANVPPQQQVAPPPGVVVLSHEFWKRRYGGDSSIIGRVIRVGGPAGSEVIGVLAPGAELLFPPGLNLERHPDAYFPLRINFADASRINVFLRFVGRLKPGVTPERAQAEVDGIVADLRQRFPIKNTAGVKWRVEPMHQYIVADVRPVILALMGAVVFVLLIACANVANLLLVRASARERELTVRAALGASRRDLVRQMLAESFVIAGGGAAIGILLAYAGTALLRAMAPASLPRVDQVGMSLPVLGFAILSAALAAVIFGLVPALRASRPDAGAVLRSTGRTAGLAAGGVLRSAVVVAEVVLSFVLLVGSGLMIRSFVALQRAQPGFEPEGLLTFFVTPPNTLNQPDARKAWMAELRQRLGALPGVQSVSGAFPVPLDGQVGNARWGTEDAVADPAKFQQADVHTVQAGYLATMRTRLLEGRALDETDNDPQRAVMMIDRVLAAKAFPGQSAVGKRLFVRLRSNDPEWIDIVGVVDHERNVSLASDGREGIYVMDGFLGFGVANRWVIRTSGDPVALEPAVRGEISRFAPSVPVSELQPMSVFVDKSMAPTRFALVLIGIFAAIAALLAAVGLYGVLATAVRQRTAEIGIRMTFGARSEGIFRMVIGQGLKLCAIGIGGGLVAAFTLTRLIRSMLVGVQPTDPVTFAAIALFFFAVASVACWLPARRAASLDPAVALREE